MDFNCQEVGIPYTCPECNGSGKKPFGLCPKCAGAGALIKAMLTYGEEYDTGGQAHRQMFAGYIERPKANPNRIY